VDRGYTITEVLTAVAMGLRNATVRRLGRVLAERRGAAACFSPGFLLTQWMAHRVRDYFFILSIDEYRLLKECLPRHSIGYAAFDLAIPTGNEERAFTCSENELQDVIQSVGHKFPLGKALANLIRQQWQPRSKSQNGKSNKPKKH
jgi:hypothetical protein